MIKSYFKIAWRTLFQNKLYTGLNIAGLTFGISFFLLIGLYLFDEWTFDQQHDKANRIYRVIEHKNTNGKELTIAGASYKLAEESKKTIGEIETTTRVTKNGDEHISNPDNPAKFYETIWMCDSNLMKVFDFDMVVGDKNTALSEPYSVILTEDLALKLFNSTQIVGKTVRIAFTETPLKVTAVLKNLPRNSSFKFHVMVSESTLGSQDWYKDMTANWASNGYTVFTLLKQKTKPQVVAKKMDHLFRDNYQLQRGTSVAFSLQPLTDIHFHSDNMTDYLFEKGNALYNYIFAIVALFVLMIACINYINLTTASAANRAKEIGIRKSVGAFRRQLFFQFLFESLIVAFLASVLSVIAVNFLLPAFNRFTGKQLLLGFSTDYRVWLYVVIVTIIIGLVSGIYPALLLSYWKTVSLLKGTGFNTGGLNLRKGLVVFQFTVSIVMMIGTMVLFLQVRYINYKNLGFNKQQLVVVDINSGAIRRSAETIKTEFGKIKEIKNVSVTSRVPGDWKITPTVKIKNEQTAVEHKIAYLISTDENFAGTFEVKLLNGRNFAGINDSSSVILNETAATMLQIKEASGQIMDIPSKAFGGNYLPLNKDNKPFKARVIGIVRDFHFRSLREKIAPMVLAYQKNPVQNIDYFTARVEGKAASATVKKMKTVLDNIDPGHLFEYHFLDEQIALFYAEDKKRETLLIGMSITNIFIACLGLFGLVTYTARQRVKEIGIRKVLGASITQLMSLLSKEFLKLVVIANVIAFPLGWWAIDQWLREFAYHIEVRWWLFGLAGVAALIIALLTVSFQAIKAAVANPVKSLRTE